MPENELNEQNEQTAPEAENAADAQNNEEQTQPEGAQVPVGRPQISNPVLVDSMAKFKVDLTNRANERAFLEAACTAKYLLPAMIERPVTPPANGEPVQARIAFQMMTNPKGDKFLPAFSDEIELSKNRKPGERFQVAVMGFMDLYRFVKDNEVINGIVINPFGGNLCLIRRQVLLIGDNNCNLDAVEAFLAQQAFKAQAQPQPQQITPSNPLGAAANSSEQQQAAIRQAMADLEAAKASEAENGADEKDYITDELLGALKGCLKKQKAVKKAYIKDETESGERFLLIALECDDEAKVAEIGETVSSDCADYADLPFECVAVSSPRAKELVEKEKPFYEKKRFGIF